MAAFVFSRLTLWDRIAAWYRGSVFHELFLHLSEDVFGVNLGEYENIAFGANAGTTVRNLIFAFAVGVVIAAGAAVYTKRVPGGFVRRLLRMGATSPEQATTLLESGYFRSVGVRWDLARGGSLAKLVCRVGDDGKTLAGTLPEAEAAETAEATEGEQPSLVARLTAESPRRPAAKPTAPTPTDAAENADVAAQVSENAPLGSETDRAEAAEQTPTNGSTDPTGAPEDPAGEAADGSNPAPEAEPAPERPPVNFLTDRFYIPEALRIRAELRYEKAGSGGRTFALTVVLTALAAFLLCRFLPSLLGLADKVLSLF